MKSGNKLKMNKHESRRERLNKRFVRSFVSQKDMLDKNGD